jgi:hypothetical protein
MTRTRTPTSRTFDPDIKNIMAVTNHYFRKAFLMHHVGELLLTPSVADAELLKIGSLDVVAVIIAAKTVAVSNHSDSETLLFT